MFSQHHHEQRLQQQQQLDHQKRHNSAEIDTPHNDAFVNSESEKSINHKDKICVDDSGKSNTRQGQSDRESRGEVGSHFERDCHVTASKGSHDYHEDSDIDVEDDHVESSDDDNTARVNIKDDTANEILSKDEEQSLRPTAREPSRQGQQPNCQGRPQSPTRANKSCHSPPSQRDHVPYYRRVCSPPSKESKNTTTPEAAPQQFSPRHAYEVSNNVEIRNKTVQGGEQIRHHKHDKHQKRRHQHSNKLYHQHHDHHHQKQQPEQQTSETATLTSPPPQIVGGFTETPNLNLPLKPRPSPHPALSHALSPAFNPYALGLTNHSQFLESKLALMSNYNISMGRFPPLGLTPDPRMCVAGQRFLPLIGQSMAASLTAGSSPITPLFPLHMKEHLSFAHQRQTN
ncbi:hypothetical protein PoB_004970700 [Plakobranchus ocellatus]|uniref:Uncharacterized protein n=1 Tax=Plakobranchus ocellatus TaxID=259542 RepID=A0AAV4BV35_9GAST|nr:hypothetical protein PoB_004970700 [Plakobranchus ocellatus]